MTRLWTLLIMTVLVAGCAGTTDTSQQPDGDDEAGHQLRLDLTAGETYSAVMSMDMGMTMTLDGEQAPSVELPTVALIMDISVEDVAEDEIVVEFSYRDLETSGGDEQVRRQMESALAAMEGVSGTITLSPRGELLDSSMELPTDLDPDLASLMQQMEQQLEQLTVPFPEEPVSVGDSWTHEDTIEISGVRSTTETTYTLTELDGDEYVIDIDLTQTTHPGPLEGPGGETVGTVEGGTLEGVGTLSGRLDRPIPENAETTASGTTRMLLEGDTDRQEMLLEMEVAMRFEPAEN